jgi:hypothetical protein
MAKATTPLESFLAPLARLASKAPEVEAEVIWSAGPDWQAQDDTAEYLDAEEIAFYAEGLLLEGFRLHYQILAEAEAPKVPAHVRLFLWQGEGPFLPDPESDLILIGSGTWSP